MWAANKEGRSPSIVVRWRRRGLKHRVPKICDMSPRSAKSLIPPPPIADSRFHL